MSSYGDYNNRSPSQVGGSQPKPPQEPKENNFTKFFKKIFNFGSIGSGSGSEPIDDYQDQTPIRTVTTTPPPQAVKADAQFPKQSSTQIVQQPAPQPQAATKMVQQTAPKVVSDPAADELRKLIIAAVYTDSSDIYYNKKLDYVKVLEVLNDLKPEHFAGIPGSKNTTCQIVKGNLIPKFTRALRMQKIPREQERDIPPLGRMDTFDLPGGVSSHGQAKFIPDDKILQKNEILKTVDIGNNDYPYIPVNYTSNNKPILQQQATRGCTAAATAMLILDRGGKVDLNALTSTNLGNDESQLAALRKGGFEPIEPSLSENNYLSDLRNALLQEGSALVGVSNRVIGQHVVVVDDISPGLDKVRIRDPYHGWEITISAETFLELTPSGAMQILSPVGKAVSTLKEKYKDNLIGNDASNQQIKDKLVNGKLDYVVQIRKSLDGDKVNMQVHYLKNNGLASDGFEASLVNPKNPTFNVGAFFDERIASIER